MRTDLRLWLLLLLLATSGCATTAADTASRGRWFELRTPRFQVWTNGDPEQARKLVIDLERFHQVMLSKTSAEEREGAPPLRIFLAKDLHSFRALIGGRGPRARGGSRVEGLFRAGYRGNYAFVHAGDGKDDDETGFSATTILLHEYAHYIMAANGARVPSWYNEGFAEYMAQTRFSDDGSYTVGCPPRYRTRWIEHLRWLPIERVMEAEHVDTLTHHSFDSYAQSWYAFHYFASDGPRNQQMSEYLRRWGEGEPPEQAAQAAFGMSYEQLDELLREYAARPAFDCAKVTPAQPLVVPDVETRPLSEAEAHLHIGDLLLATEGPTESAISVLKKAASLDRGNPRTLVALARAEWMIAQRDGVSEARLERARQYLESAKPFAQDDPEALAVLGHIESSAAGLLVQRGDKDAAAEAVKRARSAYRKAVHKDEACAEGYYGLGLTYLLMDDGAEEGTVALEAAAYLLPLDTHIPSAYARLQLERGSPLQATPALEYVLRWAKDEEQRAEARELLERIRRDATTPAAPEPQATN